jgi:hypothetical protein
MLRRIRIGGVVVAALLAAAHARAAGSQVTFVPWKVLEPGSEPVKAPLVLFWVPASAEEMRHSDLITSYRLAVYSSRCVGMQVVRTDDHAMMAKLSAARDVPLAVLVQGDREIARLSGASSPLTAAAVEGMVREAIDWREVAVNKALDDAAAKAHDGARDTAIELYKQVALDACLFPRLAKTAQRALRRLGVR